MTAPGDGCSGLSWTYDAWGNRTDQTGTGGNCFDFHAAADTNNRLVGYSYDAAGNMIWDGTHTYTYDAENRIISMDGGAATYTYDAEGHRARKMIGSTYTDYVHDPGGEVISEYQNVCGGQWCWAMEYIRLNGQFLAEYKAGTTYFVLADHLGSTRVMTQVNQAVLDSMDYEPYGRQIAGDTGTTHKFTGKERDGESGLDEFGARYYSSSLGRFMIPDWAAMPTAVPYADFGNPQSLNLYSYRSNNPLSGADTDGHCWPFCVIINTVSFKVSMFLGKHPEIGERAAAVRPTVHSKASAGYGVELPDAPVSGSATAYVQGSRGGWGVGADIGAQVQPGPRVNVNVPVVKDSQLVNPFTNASVERSVVVGGKGGKAEVEGSISDQGDVTLGGLYGEGFVAGGEFGGGFGDVFAAIGDALISDFLDKFHELENAIDFSQTHHPAPKNVAPERNQ